MWVVGGDVAGDFGEVGLGCHFGVERWVEWWVKWWVGVGGHA